MIIPTLSRFYTVLIIIGIVAVTLIFFGLIYSKAGRINQLDPAAKNILDSMGLIRTYRAHVDTWAVLGTKTLHITGTYLINAPKNSYASYSTTTLTLPGVSSIDYFTLKNISIGEDVYTKLESTSTIILRTMPLTNGWVHFKKNTIPESFTGISISGPVLDNLLIFSENGKFLTYINSVPTKVKSGTLPKYYFKLSKETPTPESTLEALFNRIGNDGMIEVSIDPQNNRLEYFKFFNKTYTSTTTVSDLNGTVTIDPPRK